jgi:putative NADPH-quinone reductase
VDRVIRPRVAYRFENGDRGEGISVGLLRAQFALVFNTSNTSTPREISVFGDPLQLLWKQCIFDLCGVKSFHREVFNVIVTSTVMQCEHWLLRVRETVRRFTLAHLVAKVTL